MRSSASEEAVQTVAPSSEAANSITEKVVPETVPELLVSKDNAQGEKVPNPGKKKFFGLSMLWWTLIIVVITVGFFVTVAMPIAIRGK